MQIWRVIEHQGRMYESHATTTNERAELLRQLIESTKPIPYESQWHELIATPFRYPVPVQIAARFRPKGSNRNILYAAQKEETALYEHAYYYFKLRRGMKKLKRVSQRTLFAASLIESAKIRDVTNDPKVAALTDPNDWAESHRFVQSNPNLAVIKYPSCRDPQRHPNFAVLDINQLKKAVDKEQVISYSHDLKAGTLHWKRFNLTIAEAIFFPPKISRKK
jgi:hypothetical protein